MDTFQASATTTSGEKNNNNNQNKTNRVPTETAFRTDPKLKQQAAFAGSMGLLMGAVMVARGITSQFGTTMWPTHAHMLLWYDASL
jgi:hypothetical protein